MNNRVTVNPDVVVAKDLPYQIRALAMAIPALLIGIQISAWGAFFNFPDAIWTRADFRDIYTSGYMVRSGYRTELYNYGVQRRLQNQMVSDRTGLLAFDHLAYETLVFVPFSYLPYQAAYFVFMACNMALFVLCFKLFEPLLKGLAGVWRWLPLGIFLGFLPGTVSLMLGQDSILILALFATATILLMRNLDFAAGALVGLAFFKFQIVLPIAFLFLAWKRWRVFTGICVVAASSGGISFLLVGASGMRDYLGLLLSMSGDSAQYKYGLTTTMMPNLRGLISGMSEHILPTRATQLVTLGASALMILVVAYAGKAVSRSCGALPIAITTAILASYHILIQDLVLLLIPIALTLERSIGTAAWNRPRQRRSFCAAAVLFAIPSVAFFFMPYFFITALAIAWFLLASVQLWSDPVLNEKCSSGILPVEHSY